MQPHVEADYHGGDASLQRATLGAADAPSPPPPTAGSLRRTSSTTSTAALAAVAPAVHATCLLHRSDTVWLAALRQARHYLYPIHPSGALLGSPTLASSLYLLLLYMLHRQHTEALRLLEVSTVRH